MLAKRNAIIYASRERPSIHPFHMNPDSLSQAPVPMLRENANHPPESRNVISLPTRHETRPMNEVAGKESELN